MILNYISLLILVITLILSTGAFLANSIKESDGSKKLLRVMLVFEYIELALLFIARFVVYRCFWKAVVRAITKTAREEFFVSGLRVSVGAFGSYIRFSVRNIAV